MKKTFCHVRFGQFIGELFAFKGMTLDSICEATHMGRETYVKLKKGWI